MSNTARSTWISDTVYSPVGLGLEVSIPRAPRLPSECRLGARTVVGRGAAGDLAVAEWRAAYQTTGVDPQADRPTVRPVA